MYLHQKRNRPLKKFLTGGLPSTTLNEQQVHDRLPSPAPNPGLWSKNLNNYHHRRVSTSPASCKEVGNHRVARSELWAGMWPQSVSLCAWDGPSQKVTPTPSPTPMPDHTGHAVAASTAGEWSRWEVNLSPRPAPALPDFSGDPG